MAIALLLPLFIGCQKDYTKPQIESPNNNITNDYSSKVNKDITELSESDAIKVANSFNANILQTRTAENPVVDVQTIRNSEGALLSMPSTMSKDTRWYLPPRTIIRS